MPTEGHLSFLRKEAQETAVAQMRIAMITFALFMIREIYCKLNSILGNPLRTERICNSIYFKNQEKTQVSDEDNDLIKQILHEQQSCHAKAKIKLPGWVEKGCLFASVPLEQCTSEQVAKAKASLFSGKNLLSLTGGLGIDDAAFANSFENIISIDTDAGLNAIARFNNKRMKITGIQRWDGAAEDFLAQDNRTWDLIYADPDRRSAGNRAAADVYSYTPDIITLHRRYQHIGKTWLIKLSPMTDMSWFEKQIDCPMRFYIFSFKGEIKELLAEVSEGISADKIIISIDDQGHQRFDMHQHLETETCNIKIFCELSSAAIKAGYRDFIIQQTGLQPVSRNGYYLQGNSLISTALGRSFELKDTLTGSLGEIDKLLKKMGIGRAHVSARDFVLSADETRKKLQLADGGKVYLFFTGKDARKTCFVTEKVA